MKLERTKNAKRNMFFGGINRIISLFGPFIIRALIIRVLGAEYLGLDSLFTSILQVLNLTELGFSNAVVYSMYKPIAKNDEKTLCAILGYFKRIYRIIGGIIFGMGICLMPFLRMLINGNYSDLINIYILYFIYLTNTAISYWMFAYKTSLLIAYQRNDIVSNIATASKLIMYSVQAIVIIACKDYYFFACILIGGTVINNLAVAYKVKKIFPNLVCDGILAYQERKKIQTKVKGLMLQKICETSRNSFDSIFISALIGLVPTAMYNNYYYIMYGVSSITVIIVTSVLSGVGNSIELDTVEKNYIDMERMNFVYMWIGGWCTICLGVLYQPFTELVYGKAMLLDYSVVILFCIYFYILKMGDVRSTYSSACGLWWENRYRAVVEAVTNLTFNFILGKLFGIYGIIIATILSLFVCNFLWGSQIIFKYYFVNVSVKKYFKQNLFYGLMTSLIAILIWLLCSRINISGLKGLGIRIVICIAFPNMLYFLIYKNTYMYKETIIWLNEKIHFKLNNKVC